MKTFWKEWTLFEKSWLLVFTVVNVYLYFAWEDSLAGLITSISGMICVVLVAKGKIANYYFGIVQTGLYAYISYSYGLYGEAMLNGLFYFPIQFIGIYMWNKHKTQNSTKGEDISVKRLSKKGWLVLILVSIVSSVLYAQILSAIGGQQVRLDSIAVVLSVIAQILMLKRFAEQWVLWILVNILSITLWIITLVQTGGNDWTMMVMWTAFLVNSIWAWFNWRKMYLAQQTNAKEEEAL